MIQPSLPGFVFLQHAVNNEFRNTIAISANKLFISRVKSTCRSTHLSKRNHASCQLQRNISILLPEDLFDRNKSYLPARCDPSCKNPFNHTGIPVIFHQKLIELMSPPKTSLSMIYLPMLEIRELKSCWISALSDPDSLEDACVPQLSKNQLVIELIVSAVRVRFDTADELGVGGEKLFH